MIECPNCGGKMLESTDECPHCGYKDPIKQRIENGAICPKCGSLDVFFDLAQVSATSKGVSEVRKKSIVTRAADTVGRGAMIAATGGLWALTPKKSKYQEIHRTETTVNNATYGVCRSCGYSWRKTF